MQGVRFLGKKGGTPRAVFPLPRAPGERCLEPRPVPARAPQNSRARWTPGRGVRIDKVGGGRGTPGLPYLARRLRRGERRRGAGGAGFQLPLARRLGGSALSARQPARPAAFNRRLPRPRPGPPPAPPPALPARALPLPIQPPPPSRLLHRPAPCASGSASLRGRRPGAVRRVVLSPPALPALRWSRCLAAPSTPQSDCVPESSRHGARGTGLGRSLSPGRTAQCYGFPSARAKGLALGSWGTTGGQVRGHVGGGWSVYTSLSLP